MSKAEQLTPDYIFEISWEVCNKVGGIYTVLSTKAQLQELKWKEQLIFIGPDIWKGPGENAEFIEDKTLFKLWKLHTEKEGLKVKIGRWNIPGKPIAVLIDFTQYIQEKNEIFKEYWIKYQLDSLSGQWDYIEPALFGHAAGKVIECYYRCHINFNDNVVAQFHEWMTGTGILFLKDKAPQIATVFTTHATVLGRVIAGNGLPLYSNFEHFIPDQVTKEFNVISKHSLEKVSAANADCFTTVSEITASECLKFLEKMPDVITHNGFDNTIVPDKVLFDKKRKNARNKVIAVAEALSGQKLPEDSLLVIKSGRYEFKNKGIDIFIDALAELRNNMSPHKTIIGMIFVPGQHTGPCRKLQETLEGIDIPILGVEKLLTHNLQGLDTDPIVNRIKLRKLDDNGNSKVKVVFVPTYMNGSDGIFNLHYYDLLIGFDLALFPSYYEPWGYTPLESLAFHIPSITTSVAGFGNVINAMFPDKHDGIYIIERNDNNEDEVVKEVARIIIEFSKKTTPEIQALRESADQISQSFSWEKQFIQYEKAYSIALEKSQLRGNLYRDKPQAEPLVLSEEMETEPLWRRVVIHEGLPEALKALNDISRNLWWSWHEEAEQLFKYIDAELWHNCHDNPVAFLQSLSYPGIKRLEEDKSFLSELNRIKHQMDVYLKEETPGNQPLVAYLSMEFGVHNSIKLYSGGLGILAGDYLKEASDQKVNMIGVGLLYREGYFKQSLSIHGEQLAEPEKVDFSKLPLDIVNDKEGNPVKITLAFPGRMVYAQAWKLNVGRICLYLLDTYVNENNQEDRAITSQLYAVPEVNRLHQEILLGIGGVQLLDALNLKPDIYHCNEGHAAFAGIRRLHDLVQDEHLSFEEAVEVVKATTLFTTHTSVPAAIDAFGEELLRPYFAHTAKNLYIDWETFMNLGRTKEGDHYDKFSMTSLSARLSGEINAVSEMHRGVSCKMFNPLWKDYQPEELHISYVTNGVHYDTWAAKEWKVLHRNSFGDGFTGDVSNPVYWKQIHTVPDKTIWDLKSKLKHDLLESIRLKLKSKLKASHESPRKIMEFMDSLNEKALIIGYAKRFVSYKRPDLLFSELTRLHEILNNPEMPVLLLYSGKAHPDDVISRNLIKKTVSLGDHPGFHNKILFLEDYDINLAKLMTQGVDLWLNTPNRFTEASGTSGMKAMLNGVLNFSVLDGWWPEAYNENIGWALESNTTYARQDFQDELDAGIIYSTLKNEILPLYFRRNKDGVPSEWIKRMKEAISVIPQYTMTRALDTYRKRYYEPLYKRGLDMRADGFAAAKELASWKKKVLSKWMQIDVLSIRLPEDTNTRSLTAKDFCARVELDIGALSVNDIGMDIIFLSKGHKHQKATNIVKEMNIARSNDEIITFEYKLDDIQPGAYEYGFRVFPKNTLLKYRQDFALVKWI